MSSETVRTFEKSLGGHADDVVRTSATEVSADLSALVEPPAVGATLRDPLSYADTPVIEDPTPHEVREATTGVSQAGLAVADYGTVTLQSTTAADEFISLYPSRHVIVVAASDIKSGMDAVFAQFDPASDGEPRSQILATGPSATADMGSLVRGVHGPESIHVLIVEDQ